MPIIKINIEQLIQTHKFKKKIFKGLKFYKLINNSKNFVHQKMIYKQ